MAYLKMEMFYDAHKDARLALNFENVDKEKAYYRKAKAEYCMRKFSSSKKTFGECLATNKENKEALDGLKKSKQRIRESKTGEYDFEYLVRNSDLSTEKCILRFDVADFRSDLITIADIPNKAKG